MSYRSLSFLFSLPFLLTACGEGTFYESASGTLAKDKASAVSSKFGTVVKISLTSAAGAPTTTRNFDACTTKEPATPVDADEDGVRAQLTTTYACSDVPTGNITSSLVGDSIEMDKDDANAAAGYRFEYNYTGGHSGGESYSNAGFFDLTRSAGTFTYNTNFRNAGSATSARSDQTWEYGHSFLFNLTGTDAENPYTAGTVTMAGFYRYKISGSASNDADVTLSIASDGLTYASNCNNFYKEGTHTLTDGAGNILKTVYANCTATTTFNDEAI